MPRLLALPARHLSRPEEQETRQHSDHTSAFIISPRQLEMVLPCRSTMKTISPELDLTNEAFAEAMQNLVTDTNLNEEQERELIRRALTEYSLLTSSRRLDVVADDIVMHFLNRGYMGKAMVVSFDKLTAVRTYNRVQQSWKFYFDELESQVQQETDTEKKTELKLKIAYMRQTNMAVLVSESQDDYERFSRFEEEHKEAVDIRPHHRRMRAQNLEQDFKNPQHPLRIVFVCNMWITGFDIPCLSTVYLDRPMRDHTLMQTIARPNRVYQDKNNGLIVDYAGTFHNLRDALAIYATAGTAGDDRLNDLPVGDKSELIRVLQDKLTELETFCQRQGLNIQALLTAQENAPDRVEREALTEAAANMLVVNDEIKLNYLALAGQVHQLYKAILPISQLAFTLHAPISSARSRLSYIPLCAVPVSTKYWTAQKNSLLNLEPREYVLRELINDPYSIEGSFDLSKTDIEALTISLKTGDTHLKAERLRGLLSQKLRQMISVNPNRVDYLERLERIIGEYNDSSANNASYPDELVEITRELQAEEQRHTREQLSEEELAVFDLLTRPDMHLSEEEREAVKGVVRNLLNKLKQGKLVLDWRKKQSTRAEVEETIKKTLDTLPGIYIPDIYHRKCGESLPVRPAIL